MEETNLMVKLIFQFIVEEGLVMIPVLYIIAEIIKGAKIMLENLIPPVLLVISLGFTPLLLGGYTAENIVQAVLVAGGAVFANQIYQQMKEYQDIKKEKEL